MILHVHIRAKFRAFGITFGTLDETVQWKPPFSIPIPIPVFRDTIFNGRGVFIEIFN